MQALRDLRLIQQQRGYDSRAVIHGRQTLTQAISELGIRQFCASYEQENHTPKLFWDEVITSDRGQAIVEVFLNAIEHGTSYGEREVVEMRFRGGKRAALVEVSDFGEGGINLPLTVEEIVQRHRNVGQYFVGAPSTYREVIEFELRRDSAPIPKGRALGSVILTLSKAIVNAERPTRGHRMLLLYDPQAIPEWWQHPKRP